MPRPAESGWPGLGHDNVDINWQPVLGSGRKSQYDRPEQRGKQRP